MVLEGNTIGNASGKKKKTKEREREKERERKGLEDPS